MMTETISTFVRWSRMTAMKINVVSALAVNGGKEIELVVETSEVYKLGTYQYTLPYEAYQRLGAPTGEIDRDTAKAVLYEEEKYRATKKAFDILAFGRNSARTLALKLRHRNFSPAICDEVAQMLKEKGYIKEDEDVIREVEGCLAKYWGGRRVLMHLHEKGYDSDAMGLAKEYLSEVDFVALCTELMKEKYGTLPKDERERQKIVAALIRYGYSTTEIKKAALAADRYDPADH